MNSRKIMNYTLSLVVAMSLMACESIPYRIDIDQGNIVEAKDLAKLRIGMTKAQVERTIGNSLLKDVFHGDRWDYVQRYKNGKTNQMSKSQITLYFANDMLSRVEKDGYQPIAIEPLPYSLSRY